jgi:voltage-gated potassium channel
MKRIRDIFIDIYDGVDDNSSISKIYLKFEVILVIALLLFICAFQLFELLNQSLYYYVYLFFILVFILQFFSRILVLPFVLEKSTGDIKVKFTKLLLLDFISGVIPIGVLIFSESNVYHLSLLSAIKIIRLFDVLPGFLFLKKAIESKKEEILYSVLLVIFSSFILSCLIYFLESSNPNSRFYSVLDTLIWSFSKYTNDYGSIADYAPNSEMSKFFATINGLLGVAVFAVPGALLSSAFIEQITQSKIDKEIEQKRKEIITLFGESYWEISELSSKEIPTFENLNETYCIVDRFWTFESIQARLMFSENEILQVARKNQNLVFRVLNDSNNNKSQRHKILELSEFPEYFDCKFSLLNSQLNEQRCNRLHYSNYQVRSYGYLFSKISNRILIISPNGGSESCINHFTATLSKITNTNYIAQTKKVRDQITKNVWNFSDIPELSRTLDYKNEFIPTEFIDFKSDIISCINNTQELNTVIIIRSADAKRGFDIDYTHGSSGENKNRFDSGSINNPENNLLLFNNIKNRLDDASIWDKSNLEKKVNYNITHNQMIHLDSETKLNNIIFKESLKNSVNCVTIYINRDIINGWGNDISGDSRYYSVINALAMSLNDFNNNVSNKNYSRVV